MSSPLSAFTAVPNPQMLAFMGAQSFIMMYQAGEGWQYGKHKQSAMSNEEFNKQTPLSIMQNQAAVLRTALPTIVKSMNDMTPMIGEIIRQYGDFMQEIIKVIPQTLLTGTGGKSPEQILFDFGQSQSKTSTDKGVTQAQLLEWLKNRFPSLPSTEGATPPPTPTGTSITLGTTPTFTKESKGSKIHFRGSILPSKKGFFQPVSAGRSQEQRFIDSITSMEKNIVILKQRVQEAIRNFAVTVHDPRLTKNRATWEAILRTRKAEHQQAANTLVMLKAQLAKMRIKR